MQPQLGLLRSARNDGNMYYEAFVISSPSAAPSLRGGRSLPDEAIQQFIEGVQPRRGLLRSAGQRTPTFGSQPRRTAAGVMTEKGIDGASHYALPRAGRVDGSWRRYR